MTGVNHFQSLTDQPIKLEISLKISWRSSQLECKTESARIEAIFSLYTPLLPLTMCTLYLSKNHSHIHVSDIVRGSGSVHIGKKNDCRDYVHLAKTWRSQDYVCPSPYRKMRLLPLSAQAQYSKYLKNASGLRQ